MAPKSKKSSILNYSFLKSVTFLFKQYKYHISHYTGEDF